MPNPTRVVLVLTAAVSAWAQRGLAQPLPSDPSLVKGDLENGLHYVVRKNAVPPGRAVMWIHMHTGSLNETDRQRGIAHYTEHMAFNGSENFAPGTLVPFFESLGMTFGRDQNAYTNMQETTYQLTLPDTKSETLGKGLTFFSDVVSRLSFVPKEIDDERQIILEERRRGLSGRSRTNDYVMEHLIPGSLYGYRLTIGKEETIKAVNQQDFKDYYGKWYGASNATVIVVGDAEPAEVVKLITEKFGSSPKRPRPVAQDLHVKAYDKSFAVVTSDAELRTGDVRITRVEPSHPAVTTVPLYRDELVLGLGESSFNRRIRDKVSDGTVSFQSASASSGDDSNAIHESTVSATVLPEKWRDGLSDMAMELQRARTFGFTAREIEDAKTQVMRGAERAVETEGTAESATFVRRINGDVARGVPTMSATQRLELLKQVLPSITKEDVDARFAKEFDFSVAAFVAVLPSGAGVPTDKELLDLGTKALSVKPAAEKEVARATTLMTDLPKPGAIKDISEHAATHVWTGWLTNNTRVNYRFMNERENEATVRITLYGGELFETAENRGVTSAASAGWANHATKKLTSADIREITTGWKANVGGFGFGGGRGGGGRGRGGGGGGGGDSISLSIGGNPEEFEKAFQLAYLLLTEPKLEQPAFERYQAVTRRFMEEIEKTPEGVAGRLIAAAPYPESDPRTRPLTPEQVDKLTLPATQAWLEKLLKESPIEVTIVGDIERQKALDLVAKYIGALPARERVSPESFRSLRTLQRPDGPRVFEKTVKTATAKGQVFSGFYGADDTNLADTRALSMAARILSTRMTKEVREQDQLVYSIGASSRPATTYPGFGIFSASAPTEPAKVDALAAKLPAMYETLAKDGPSEEEMEVAKKQFAKDFEEQWKQPQFWSGRLSEMGFRGTKLDDIVEAPAAYAALTAAQVKATFAKYYSKKNSIVVVVKPDLTGAKEGEAKN